jgi:soluble lytic murein transglycosylase-like protein
MRKANEKRGCMDTVIMLLIITIAVEIGIPPYFTLAIALTENNTLNPLAVSPLNENGTVDLGIMQLNSRYYGDINWRDPETNIRTGCQHIKSLIDNPGLNTYWGVAASYNCGVGRFLTEGPPPQTIDYACRVMERWLYLTNMKYINPIIQRRYM